jgi:hypothetical protein
MDITITELKTMKAKQLRRLVREAINEVLKEDAAAEKVAQDAAKIANAKQMDALKKHLAKINSTPVASTEKPAQDAEKQAINKKLAILQKKAQELNKPGMSAMDINELARIAKGYQLAKDDIDTAPFANKKISGVPLMDIIEYFREHPGTEKAQLQKQFGFVRPQITNALVNALLDAGILVKVGEPEGSVTEPVEPGEEEQSPHVVASEPEDMFVGGDEGDVLSMYFDKQPNANGEEDFDDNTEPEVGDIAKTTPAAAAKVSNQDFEDSLKYSELERRLAATKSNIAKLKKSRPSVGDIKDKPSDELVRLRTLRASLEQRIADLIASSEYVKKMATGKSTAVPEEPIIDLGDEEETDEEPLDEWTINKMKYYAGIIK